MITLSRLENDWIWHSCKYGLLYFIVQNMFIIHMEQGIENTSVYRYNECKEVRENANQ